MWARRIAALALALGLVAAAFVIRDRRSAPDETGGPDTSSGPTTPGGTASNPTAGFTLVCVSELRAACQGADLGDGVTVRIEPAGTTVAALVAAADPATVADAWLTVDPWPALVDQRRAAGGSPTWYGADVPLVAHSPVGVAVRKQRDAVLATACGGTITLACAVEKGGAAWASLPGGSVTWQKVRPSVSDPTRSATGLASLTAAVREQRRDAGLTLGELDADTAFGSWLARVERSDYGRGSPLAQSIGVPQFDVVLVPEAEFESTAGATNDFVFVGVSTHETAVALAMRTGAAAPKGLADTLTTRLQQSGWTVGAPTAAPLDANLMAGIQQLWKDRQS